VKWNLAKEFSFEGVMTMKWNRNLGNWNQMTGQEKKKLGSTSDDGLSMVEVWQDQLECLLQRRYGYAREQTRTELLSAFDAGLYSLSQHDTDAQVSVSKGFGPATLR
jgi:uncharacterized protein YjbJ (UPF0337 family)